MKLFLICVVFMTPGWAFAKKGQSETEALYLVPSEPELINHSRFIVSIVEPFKGPETEKISYIFPEILIGEADRVIELVRIDGTENSWTSPEIIAHCTVLQDHFSCNIHINKDQKSAQRSPLLDLFLPQAWAAQGALCKGQAIAHLQTKGLPQFDIDSYTKVIGNFCASEPAGFLSYEFQ